mmetsp:Transcript_54807/g.119324  ORF Transcript_54807/g.119324 Transcript_54807/m.119324 type:complete len:335 (+) Transcript_54807:764-1768(+)
MDRRRSSRGPRRQDRPGTLPHPRRVSGVLQERGRVARGRQAQHPGECQAHFGRGRGTSSAECEDLDARGGHGGDKQGEATCAAQGVGVGAQRGASVEGGGGARVGGRRSHHALSRRRGRLLPSQRGAMARPRTARELRERPGRAEQRAEQAASRTCHLADGGQAGGGEQQRGDSAPHRRTRPQVVCTAAAEDCDGPRLLAQGGGGGGEARLPPRRRGHHTRHLGHQRRGPRPQTGVGRRRRRSLVQELCGVCSGDPGPRADGVPREEAALDEGGAAGETPWFGGDSRRSPLQGHDLLSQGMAAVAHGGQGEVAGRGRRRGATHSQRGVLRQRGQ